MVRMGDVWDRTLEVLHGRGGMLAGIAAATLFVPSAINAAYAAYVAPTTGTAMLGALVTLLTVIAALWGQLALIAASSDPATDRGPAFRRANARLLPTLAVAFLMALLFSLIFTPAIALMAAAGVDLTRIGSGATPAPTSPGLMLGAGLYAMAALVVVLFAGARLVPLYAVALHERRGAGAIARTWRLTRRHSWRLVGVVLLFLVVLMVATWAAQSVSGLIARLLLGPVATATVTFVAALVSGAASTALTLVAVVFSAQLYLALIAREAALRARAAQAVPAAFAPSQQPIGDA